jgi:hypothetical protein
MFLLNEIRHCCPLNGGKPTRPRFNDVAFGDQAVAKDTHPNTHPMTREESHVVVLTILLCYRKLEPGINSNVNS